MTEPYMIITCAVILRAEQFKLSRLAYKGRLTKNLALLDRRENVTSPNFADAKP